MADPTKWSRSHAGAGCGPEAGTATAELAVALPAVVLALTAVIAAGQAVVGQVACVDAARAAARAASRGDNPGHVVEVARAAAGAPVDVSVGGADPVVVEVRRELRLVLGSGPRLRLSARAAAQREVPATSPSDAGSATVLVLTAVLLAMVLAVSGLTVGGVTVARHRAQSAADLAALAGANVLSGGSPGGGSPGGGSPRGAAAPGTACGTAASVALRNGARVADCLVGAGASGGTVTVRVQVRPAGPAGRWGATQAVARAGPAGAP